MKKIFGLYTLLLAFCLFSWCFVSVDEGAQNEVKEMTWETVSVDDFKAKYFTAFWTEPYWDFEISWWIAHLNSPMFETDYSEPVNIWKDGENYYFSWEELDWEFIKKDCIDWWKWDLHYYTVWVGKFREYAYEGCWDDEEGIKMSDEELVTENNIPVSNLDLSWIEGFIRNCETYQPYWLSRSDTAENISFTWNSKENVWKSYRIGWFIKYSIDWNEYSDNVACTFMTSEVSEDWKEYYSYLQHNEAVDSPERMDCLDWIVGYQPEWMNWDPSTIITVWCWPENYWEKYVTWYLYTTTYPDLWLRITTPTWFETFHKKAESPIFTRNWNRISYMNWDREVEYLQVYDKKESESLENLIKQKHLKEWCVVIEYNYYTQGTVFADYPWTILYNVFDESWWMPWKCLPDDEAKVWDEWDWRTIFYFESKDKTKYYKLARTDWCAPWPCSMFWEIEIF